jgi:hypothetical protein
VLDPLGVKHSSYTAAAIEAAPDHAQGHGWTPSGTSPVPFTQIFPYDFGGAGDINSNIEDVAQWLHLQLDDGSFGDERLVSAGNLASPAPKIADRQSRLCHTGCLCDAERVSSGTMAAPPASGPHRVLARDACRHRRVSLRKTTACRNPGAVDLRPIRGIAGGLSQRPSSGRRPDTGAEKPPPAQPRASALGRG